MNASTFRHSRWESDAGGSTRPEVLLLAPAKRGGCLGNEKCFATRVVVSSTVDASEHDDVVAALMFAWAAHELASPLAALVSNLAIAQELVDEVGGASELREVLADLVVSTRGIARIGESLRELALSEVSEPTPLARVVEHALRATRPLTTRCCSTQSAISPELVTASPGKHFRWLCATIVALVRGCAGEGAATRRLRIEVEQGDLVVVMSPHPGSPNLVGATLERGGVWAHDGIGVFARRALVQRPDPGRT